MTQLVPTRVWTNLFDSIPVDATTIGAKRVVIALPKTDTPYSASTQEGILPNTLELFIAAVRRCYSEVNEVESIYRSIVGNRLRFFIFTSNEVFDIDLIKRLSGIEYDLAGLYPDIGQDYEYVPSMLVADVRDFLGSNAIEEYLRQK